MCFELGERQPNCMVEPISSVTGDLGGGMKNLKEDIKILLWNKKRLWKKSEMQKAVLWDRMKQKCVNYCLDCWHEISLKD